MIKVGLIGEDPNDKDAIKNLLSKSYSSKVNFVSMLKNLKGHQLDNIRTSNSLSIEFKNKIPDIIIFIRDADGIETEPIKIKKVKDWFSKLNKVVEKKGILLCTIYELEALILADIETFNKEYNTKIKYTKNVAFQKEPKEYLMNKTHSLNKKYKESDCPVLFSKLNIETIKVKCNYFNNFINDFENEIKKFK